MERERRGISLFVEVEYRGSPVTRKCYGQDTSAGSIVHVHSRTRNESLSTIYNYRRSLIILFSKIPRVKSRLFNNSGRISVRPAICQLMLALL